ncbi:hypothetical protein ZWY2020_014795 [Hordeum vulgare]|nr:hypothetical protein ZWY2020_014795 [Hordeum vulgare]
MYHTFSFWMPCSILWIPDKGENPTSCFSSTNYLERYSHRHLPCRFMQLLTLDRSRSKYNFVNQMKRNSGKATAPQKTK